MRTIYCVKINNNGYIKTWTFDSEGEVKTFCSEIRAIYPEVQIEIWKEEKNY